MKRFNSRIIITDHFQLRCWERNINPNQIRAILHNSPALIENSKPFCLHPNFLGSVGLRCKFGLCTVIIRRKQIFITCFERSQNECEKLINVIHFK